MILGGIFNFFFLQNVMTFLNENDQKILDGINPPPFSGKNLGRRGGGVIREDKVVIFLKNLYFSKMAPNHV